MFQSIDWVQAWVYYPTYVIGVIVIVPSSVVVSVIISAISIAYQVMASETVVTE